MSVSDDYIKYLEAVEKKPFSPIGPLYTSIFESLLEKGFVHLEAAGYILSTAGAEVLAEHRKKV